MSRRRKQRGLGGYKPRPTETVTLDIPKEIDPYIPSEIFINPPDPLQYKKRIRRIPLKQPSRGTTRRRLKLIFLSGTRRARKPAYSMIDRYGRLNIYSRERSEKYAERERSRFRIAEEPKGTFRRSAEGYLESVKSDRFGIIGANRRRKPSEIHSAAAVSRYIERKWERGDL